MTSGKGKETLVDSRRQQILARFRERGGEARTGLFTPTTRKRLFGEIPKGKKEIEYKPQKRYQIREQVKTAFIDLQLFIEMGDKDSVNYSITRESIEPLVEALFLRPIKENAEPNLNRVKIAQLFIHRGFQYLQQIGKDRANKFHREAIRESLETCDALTNLLLPYGEKWEPPE